MYGVFGVAKESHLQVVSQICDWISVGGSILCRKSKISLQPDDTQS